MSASIIWIRSLSCRDLCGGSLVVRCGGGAGGEALAAGSVGAAAGGTGTAVETAGAAGAGGGWMGTTGIVAMGAAGDGGGGGAETASEAAGATGAGGGDSRSPARGNDGPPMAGTNWAATLVSLESWRRISTMNISKFTSPSGT